jgi:hypothetical protein
VRLITLLPCEQLLLGDPTCSLAALQVLDLEGAASGADAAGASMLVSLGVPGMMLILLKQLQLGGPACRLAMELSITYRQDDPGPRPAVQQW